MAAIQKIYAPNGSSFVSCHCNCGASGPASSWYHGLTKCPKGAATPQEWLDTFQLKEAAGKPAKGKGKKNAEASSKASTPTKDGENAENAAADEEPKKKAAKKQKVAKEDKEPKTPKAKKAAEDNGEPKEKRPQGAYFIYCEEKRKEATEADADKKLGAKELGEMWKALSDEDKAPYVAKAAELKAAYDATKPPSKAEQKKAAKAEGPQKAKSAYMLFTMAKRAEVVEEFPGIQAKEVMKLLGAKWKELSAEDKAEWEEKAKAEKEALAAGADKVDAAGSKRKSPEKDSEEAKDEEEAAESSAAQEADETDGAKASQEEGKDEAGDADMKEDAVEDKEKEDKVEEDKDE